jgi:hypothetical protein
MRFPQSLKFHILGIQQVATVGSCGFGTILVQLNSAFFHDAIALAEHDDAGFPVFDLMFGDVGEAHDGEDVTSSSLEGSRAVEDDLARNRDRRGWRRSRSDFRLPCCCTGCARKV